MGSIEFTDNYQDLSTDKGFQFRFHCERCGNGYLSTYKLNKLGVAGGLLEAASNFFGGVLGGAADSAYDVQRAIGGKAHDEALREAIEEMRPKFVQCHHCGQWTCRDVCFNPNADMCKQCAPRADEVETSLRAHHVEAQTTNDLFLEENQRMAKKASEVAEKCPACGEPTLGRKFCPSCGTPRRTAPTVCPSCGVKTTPKAKFCGDCGAKLA